MVLPQGAILRHSRGHLVGGYQHGRQQHAGVAAVAAAADAADAVSTAVCGTPRHQVCEGVDVSLRLLPRDAWVRLHDIMRLAAFIRGNGRVTARNMHSADQLENTE